MNDSETIKARLVFNDRLFMIRSLDPGRAPRIAPAARALRTLLADGRWHTFEELVASAVRSSDVSVKTITGLLHRLRVTGMVLREGEWQRGGVDSRRFKLVDWPEHE